MRPTRRILLHRTGVFRENGEVNAVPSIAAGRVAGIRPAMPAVGSDPYEDGLDAELVTEPALQQRPVALVGAAASAQEPGHDPARRAYATNAVGAVTQVAPIASPSVPAGRGAGAAQGNAAVATGFDARPASNLGDAPRGSFASPFARAMQSYSQG